MAMNELVRPAESREWALRAPTLVFMASSLMPPLFRGGAPKNVIGLGYILLSDAAYLHASMRGLGSRVRNP